MKRFASLAIILGFFFAASIPAFSASFTGMVIDSTVYNIIVKDGKDVKIFQIRPETRGDRNARPEDTVRVDYENLSSILVATNIKVLARKYH